MEAVRKSFQGVLNIVRFNWHFYVLSISVVLFMIWLANYVDLSIQFFIYVLSALAIVTTLVSLIVSFYIYDVSGLYKFSWLNDVVKQPQHLIVNINAGFDETSILLKQKFPGTQLTVLDFYDPVKHTEISIKRARKAYPPFAGTMQTATTALPLNDNVADIVFVILAAHEIRNINERIAFFKELGRVVKQGGQIVVTEHIRDPANFFAFNIGFFHFYSKNSWYNSFKHAGFKLQKTVKITPFISTFILSKNGDTF